MPFCVGINDVELEVSKGIVHDLSHETSHNVYINLERFNFDPSKNIC